MKLKCKMVIFLATIIFALFNICRAQIPLPTFLERFNTNNGSVDGHGRKYFMHNGVRRLIVHSGSADDKNPPVTETNEFDIPTTNPPSTRKPRTIINEWDFRNSKQEFGYTDMYNIKYSRQEGVKDFRKTESIANIPIRCDIENGQITNLSKCCPSAWPYMSNNNISNMVYDLVKNELHWEEPTEKRIHICRRRFMKPLDWDNPSKRRANKNVCYTPHTYHLQDFFTTCYGALDTLKKGTGMTINYVAKNNTAVWSASSDSDKCLGLKQIRIILILLSIF